MEEGTRLLVAHKSAVFDVSESAEILSEILGFGLGMASSDKHLDLFLRRRVRVRFHFEFIRREDLFKPL